MIFLELFITFFVIGIFTIGGGYAMLSLIQTQIVNVHGWLSEEQFADIVAISQMTPGPIGINCATYVGYDTVINSCSSQALAVLGAVTATLAVVLPSFLIVLAICRAYDRFQSSRMFKDVMRGIKPVVAGLIGAAAIILITPGNFPDWTSWVLFGMAFIASYWCKANPIAVIITGGIIGFLIY